MNIREHNPTDSLGRLRIDIIEYLHEDKHIATLIKPGMSLIINGDKAYRVKDEEDAYNHIREFYFKEI